MATKIQFRRGNAAAVPSLDIAEPGYDIDTKTFRIGDGTTSPPRVPTTKSAGSFDFSTVTDFRIPRLILGLGAASAVSLYFNASDSDTGLWSPGAGQFAISSNGTTRFLLDTTGVNITGDLDVTGNVDGVKISKLNPVGVNGILVKTGSNNFAPRALVNGVGIAPFRNVDGASNPSGVAGDIVVQIADNATIPGNAAIKIPAGTTGERAGVAAINGHFRYNTSKKSFEGYIDGEWREFVDYVEGKVVNVPSQFASIQDAIDYFNNRSTKSAVYIQLENGVQSVTSAAGLSSGSRTNRIIIRGATPVNIPLDINGTPIVSVSGAAGNWSVVLKLTQAIPDWLAVGPSGHSVIISDISASGMEPYDIWTGAQAIGIAPSKTTLNLVSAKDSNGVVIPASSYYAANDYITTAGIYGPLELKRITAVPSTLTMTVNSAFLEEAPTSFMHRKWRAITGTLAATNSTTITGTGTQFTSQLNVGDHLILMGTMQIVRVKTIVNDTSFTTDYAVTIGTGLGLNGLANNMAVQYIPVNMHEGCWQVTAKNTVDRTITITNTNRSSVPPPIRGIRKGNVTFLPSSVLFTGSKFFTVFDNEYLGLSNLTVRYSGATPTNQNFGVIFVNGYGVFSGTVGFNNAPVHLSRNSSLSVQGTTAICATGSGAYGLAVMYSSTIDFDKIITNGGNGGGIYFYSSNFVGKRVTASGNTGFGLFSSGGANMTINRVVACDNRLNGVRVDSMDRVSTDMVDLISNGWLSPVGVTQTCWVQNLTVGGGSAFTMYNGNSLVLSANSHNCLVTNNSWIAARSSLIGNTPTRNIDATHSSYVFLNGTLIRNCEGSISVNVQLGSQIFTAGCGESMDYGKGHALMVVHGSFGYINGGNTNCAAVTYIRRGSLSAATNYDVAVRYVSNLYVYKVKGSGAANVLISSPGLNAAPAYVNSSIYGVAV